jgi:hypothetical protein
MGRFEGLTSQQAVKQAIDEYRRLGRAAFLRLHALPRAKRGFIERGEEHLEAEPIFIRAYHLQHGTLPPEGRGAESLEQTAQRLGLVLFESPYHYLVLTQNERHARPEFEKWQDVKGERYHFPNRYRNLIVEGRDFLYYRGARRADKRRAVPEYFGWARIGAVYPDPATAHLPKSKQHWLCEVEDYHEFKRAVPFKDAKGDYVELDGEPPPQRYGRMG